MTEEDQINYFKNKVFNDFNNNGIFENLKVIKKILKTQIRYKLLEKIQSNVENSEPDKSLNSKIITSLFQEYLEIKNYNYT